MKFTGTDIPKKMNTGKQLLLVFVISLLVIAATAGTFLKFYGNYITEVLYHERLSQMREVTMQLFSGLEDVVENQWETVEIQSNYLKHAKPQTEEEMTAFLQQQLQLDRLEKSEAKLIVTDNLGRYYTQDGLQGSLDEMNYLLDHPERISFVTNQMTTADTRMVFLKRLDTPLSMQVGEKTVTIQYYGFSKNMDELTPYFDCSAYNGKSSVYVVDDAGTKMFRSSNADIIKGHNVYSVLENMEYLHKNSFQYTKRVLDTTHQAYSNAVLDGTEYYYALYQMDHAEWTILFLVPSAAVATNTVELINTTIELILGFAVVLVILCAGLVFLLLRMKQKQEIAAERAVSQTLTEMNEVLDRKNAELSAAVQNAEQANKAKSDFLSNMSHDIRTPMNAIVGITNLMANEPDLSDKLNTYIHKVQLSSRHLLSLINDVLDMSKIESSGVALNHEPVSLAEQIWLVDSVIRSQTNQKRQNFYIYMHEIVHEYLITDGTRLRQLFLNLLSNATKYTPYGGSVTLDMAELASDTPDSAKFRITVSDTGYGMEPAFLEHIFEPFTRAESSTTNKVQGTGLGMAITKSIIDLMGGTISVTSEVNKGSRFEIMLSLQIDTEVSHDIGMDTILVLSDNQTLAHNIRASLQETDTKLLFAETEEEALSILHTESIDLILFGENVYTPALAEEIKHLREATSDIALIFCVDYVQTEEIQKILAQSGADAVVSRPFFRANLLRSIDHLYHTDAEEEKNGGSVLKGLRFLAAEDNTLNAEILEALLEMHGASCDIYPDGEQLVEAFRDTEPGKYAAILMDVQMPNMNGLDATVAIRSGKNPLGQTIPIIAMTANAFAEDIRDCLAAGMDAHISKPLDLATLERTVRKFVTPPPSPQQVDERLSDAD